ncbi:MAG: erythromycin esterase family protein [Planctomycetes bacterium]|nr:erythromycin esterase family protein [Planctomycetota bacterium]
MTHTALASTLRRLAVPAFSLFVAACSAPVPKDDVVSWLRANAVATHGRDAFRGLDPIFARSRVVGLGEATHGQHESFETKRELTLHLVRHDGYRLIAFEAGATRAAVCEEYLSGRSDDLEAALSGLGMLFRIDENAVLLEELRKWNDATSPAERVHLVGVDPSDVRGSSKRLATLLESVSPELEASATSLATEFQDAVAKLPSGDRTDYERVNVAAIGLAGRVDALCAARKDVPAEAALRATELRWGVAAAGSDGGRDHAMAEMLLASLASFGPQTRAVLWAHNGHVLHAPLRYMESAELSTGGHLAAALGPDYYAFGFLFGSGGFQALERTDAGSYGYRRHELGAPPPNSLEAPFVEAARGDCVVDLRAGPKSGAIGAWLDSGHGQRWFGGLVEAEQLADASGDASQLLPTFPRADFDGLIFLERTTPASPRDRTRILGSS